MASERSKRSPTWTLVEALDLVERLYPVLRERGWAVGLTGSVLLAGLSYKDLDLILYPQSVPSSTYDAAVEVLERFGLQRLFTVEEVHAHWREKGSADTKHVEIWCLRDTAARPPYRRRRIDIFFMQ